MGWMGKVVGGAIGFVLGGPLGAVAGAAFGHVLDKSEGERQANYLDYVEERVALSRAETAQYTFFIATFSMLAKLAKADGHISRAEIDSIERFMVNDLNMNPESRRIAINIFHTALSSLETFQDYAMQFYGQFRAQPRMLEFMIDILIRVSVADGAQSPAEERLIHEAVRIFHMGEAEYLRLRSVYIRDSGKYYSVLGCDPDDSDDHIKKQYRKLVMEYHPDRIISKGLPEEFMNVAQEKFREIQEAYEEIKKERGLT